MSSKSSKSRNIKSKMASIHESSDEEEDCPLFVRSPAPQSQKSYSIANRQSQQSFSVMGLQSSNQNNQSQGQSHSIIDKVSIDDSGFSEENKSEPPGVNEDKPETKFKAKPKNIVILAKDFDAIIPKTAKVTLEINNDNNELCLTLKDKTLETNFKNIVSTIKERLTNYKTKVLIHSKSINELKQILDSTKIKDLMKRFPDFSIFKYNEFRDIAEKLKQKFEYFQGLDYFKEKSQKKPRFCFISCKQENLQLIEDSLKNSSFGFKNNTKIDRIEVNFPIEAKISENFLENLLSPQLKDFDFQINFWLFNEKLKLEIQNMKNSSRKIREEIENTLNEFNKKAVFMIEIKEQINHRYIQSIFRNLYKKSDEYGLKFKVISCNIAANQNMTDHKKFYEICKKQIARETGNAKLRYFFVIKGNAKTLGENSMNFECFLNNIKPRILKVPFDLPIKIPSNLKIFMKDFLEEEINLSCKNNGLICENFLIQNSQLEITLIGAEKSWPLLANGFLEEREKEMEQKLKTQVTEFLQSFAYAEIDKNIKEIDNALSNNLNQKVTCFKAFLQKFELFSETISQGQLILISRSDEQMKKALNFLESNFSVNIETKDIFIEDPVIFNYLLQNQKELNKISDSISIILDKIVFKATISSPQINFSTNLDKFHTYIGDLKSKILIKEVSLDLLTLQELKKKTEAVPDPKINKKKIDLLQEKFQCSIEMCPQLTDIPSLPEAVTRPEIIIKLGPNKEKTLHILQGDIFENSNELMVIPVDKNLLFNGGIALSLREKLGQTLDDFSAKYLKDNKSLEVGECAFCGLKGKNFKNLMLVINPSYHGDQLMDKTAREYKNFIIKLFEQSNARGIQTVTVPIIGAGNNQFPIKQACKLLLQHTIDYLNSNITAVRNVIIIEKDFEKFKSLSKEIKFIEETYQTAFIQNQPQIQIKKKDTYRWSWNLFENGQDYFEEYDLETSDLLEKSFSQKLELADISGYIPVNYKEPSHSFDFNTNQVTHLRLQTTKRFFRKKEGVWAFDEGLNKEYAFSNKICEILENYYMQKNYRSPLQIFINNYSVYLKESKWEDSKNYFTQENIDTKFKRKVLRNKKTVVFQDYVMPQNNLKLDIYVEKRDEQIENRYNIQKFEEDKKNDEFVGLKIKCLDPQAINACFNELQDELNNLVQKGDFPSNKEIELDFENVKTLAEHLKIEIYLLTDQKLICRGLRQNLTKFFNYVKVKYLLMEKIFPDSWENFEEFRIFDLEKNTIEFEEVARNFKDSLEKPVKILKISRVENQKLWLNYIKQKKKLMEKYEHFEVTEERLYYQLEDPNNFETLIKEDGISLANCTKKGAFGQGIYLSKHAKAFHSGFLLKKNQTNQMILCKSLVGVIQEAKQTKKDRTGLDLIEDSVNKRYDSLEYVSPQGVVIVIFDDDRVYPEYVIDYSF